MAQYPPKLDAATIGISFVDILFALAAGQVLDPIKNWAEDPKTNPLPFFVWTQLGVVLILILTSWVGYHSSANRPRFRLHFFNSELVKFTLDVAMVFVYFAAAAVAARIAPTLTVLTLTISVSFLLYSLWDIVGAIQKGGVGNLYEQEWQRVKAMPERPDVFENWEPTQWKRIYITFIWLVITATFFLATIWITALHHPTSSAVVVADAVAAFVLITYRVAKDSVTPEVPAPEQRNQSGEQVAPAAAAVSEPAPDATNSRCRPAH